MKQLTFMTIRAMALISLLSFAEVANVLDSYHPANNTAVQRRQPPGMISMPMMGMRKHADDGRNDSLDEH